MSRFRGRHPCPARAFEIGFPTPCDAEVLSPGSALKPASNGKQSKKPNISSCVDLKGRKIKNHSNISMCGEVSMGFASAAGKVRSLLQGPAPGRTWRFSQRGSTAIFQRYS
jgi:hypothetical protein